MMPHAMRPLKNSLFFFRSMDFACQFLPSSSPVSLAVLSSSFSAEREPRLHSLRGA